MAISAGDRVVIVRPGNPLQGMTGTVLAVKPDGLIIVALPLQGAPVLSLPHIFRPEHLQRVQEASPADHEWEETLSKTDDL
jgi:hypothetical protein